MDENEEYYRDQYNIQKYIQSTEWERQVGRPVMNFLPGGIGFVYNTTDTLQGSYALGEGIGQVYRDGEFKTDSVLKMVDGVLTLAPVVASNIIPKGNSSTVAGKGTAANKPLDKTDLELQHGKGNVEQGGGNYKETKDKILDNQAANQKANESSKFGEHVAKEQQINAGKGTSGTTQAGNNALNYVDEPPFKPAGTASAAQSWSIKGRLNYVQLPTEGKIRFIPAETYSPTNPLPRGPNNGYLDKFGNEWVKGPSRTAGKAFEWDVQLSSKGKAQLGWASRDGSHLNVSLDGKITHK